MDSGLKTALPRCGAWLYPSAFAVLSLAELARFRIDGME
jgi:hypothetical protein